MIRVLIANDTHASYLALKNSLQTWSEISVVGLAATGEETRLLARHADVILLNDYLEEKLTAQLVRDVVRAHPTVRVLVTGVTENPRTILKYVEMGAVGYILQEEPAAALLRKVRAAHAGEAVVSPRIAALLMAHLAQLTMRARLLTGQIDHQDFELLTAREMEVLEKVAEGRTNEQIAACLTIRTGTVKNHVHHILKKLNSSSRYEAATAYKAWRRRDEATTAYVVPVPASY